MAWFTSSTDTQCAYFRKRMFSQFFVKVHIFWESHKILRNLHRRFDHFYIGQISQKFVAFSEYMNFIFSKSKNIWIAVYWMLCKFFDFLPISRIMPQEHLDLGQAVSFHRIHDSYLVMVGRSILYIGNSIHRDMPVH